MELTGEVGKLFAPRIFRITFPPSRRWHGLEARIWDAPAGALATMLIAAPLAAEVAAGSPRAITVHHGTAADLLIREFAPLITEWNASDGNGNPVQPDEAGLRGADFAMVMALFEEWRIGRAERPDQDDEDEEAVDLSSIPMTPVPSAPG